MKNFKNYFKKKKETNVKQKNVPTKEELIDMIDNNSAYLHIFFPHSDKTHTKAIRYNKEDDEFLLIFQGAVSRIKYKYDYLIQYLKELNVDRMSWIDNVE